MNVTTDKVYLNEEQEVPFTEDMPLDGLDPYSNSKSCSELVTHSYVHSFLRAQEVAVSTVRAGNVIGGGDWALDRIIPDCIKALEQDKVIDIRSPKAIRPWEHVLEPLSGYMLLAKKQWEKPTEFCEGWNFGPESESVSTVWEVATELIKNYGKGELKDSSDPNAVHEAKLLMLDITKAKTKLGWKPRMNMQQCMDLVADWYKRYRSDNVYQLCVEEIEKFVNY